MRSRLRRVGKVRDDESRHVRIYATDVGREMGSGQGTSEGFGSCDFVSSVILDRPEQNMIGGWCAYLEGKISDELSRVVVESSLPS